MQKIKNYVSVEAVYTQKNSLENKIKKYIEKRQLNL